MQSSQIIDSTPVMLEEPHFDDELTVVTAQPVVPLEVFAHEQTLKKRWLLAGAFALSLLLGAGSALLAIRIKRQAALTPPVQTTAEEVVTTEPPSIQGGETTALASNIESEPLESLAPEVEETKAPERAKKVATPQRNASKNQPAKKTEVRHDERKEPARLVDQWEERRTRRVWRRERRDRLQHQDLFRVGEIFEGSRPRRNPN
jgi:hypothetical protein